MTSEIIIIPKPGGCKGSIPISGAKNAVLPLMAACLLTDKKVELQNVPDIDDVKTMKTQLISYGVSIETRGSSLILQASNQTNSSPLSSDGAKIRGAFLVLGALLARFKSAKVYYPGGCEIDRDGRKVDYHINALMQMRATNESSNKYALLKAGNGLHRAEINFPKISVGATQNVIMAACLARGKTVITNASVEPEVIDLITILKAMGMGENIQVDEAGNTILIEGRNGALLNGCTHRVLPDRIEAGTWAIAAAVKGGSLLLKMDVQKGQKIMHPIVEKLKSAGMKVEWQNDGLKVQRQGELKPVDVTTGPFPEFPTDLLPQWVTLMTLANGRSILKDTIWNKRFNHVKYLKEMGAKIEQVSDEEYHVYGKSRLRGTRVEAPDLRAGVALILAGLAAEGSTVVRGFHHVNRGYDNIVKKLITYCGVDVQVLPQTRPGFHGGNLMMEKKHDVENI